MIKEKVEALVKAYSDDKEVLALIEDGLNSFSEYVKVVNNLENAIAVGRFKLSPEDFREKVENLDRNRRIVHNGVIASTKFLNNFCLLKKLPLFFEGDVADRLEVAEFAMLVAKEIFDERKK